MIAIERVAGAGEVEVAAAIARIEVIEHFVGATPEIDPGAVAVPFCGVIEYHIEDDADAGGVQRPHQVFELRRLPALLRRTAVARMGTPETVGVVAPVVPEPARRSAARHTLLIERHHRQQLDVRDAELQKIGNLLRQAAEGARPGRTRGGMLRKATDMQFIDHGAFEPARDRPLAAPVE
jgi:hypothetical protein